MAIDLGRASITMMPDWSRLNQAAVNRQMGKLNAEVGVITKKGDLDKITRQFKAEGTKAGDGFTRGADGKLRGANDRIVKSLDFDGVSRKAGIGGAEAGRKFATSMSKEANDKIGKGGLLRAGALAGAVSGIAGAAANAVGNQMGQGLEWMKNSTTEAANLEQSIGAIDSIFKTSAGNMHNWSKNAAEAVGLSKNEYNELATIMGAQLKNGGTSIDQLDDKTNDLIKTGADLSAMFGGTTADAVAALSSALKGERDPIERYGVSLKQASIDAEALRLGHKKGKDGFSNQAQQAATLSLIMKQTSDAHGTFSKESDTAAHKSQVLAARQKDLSSKVGELLMPLREVATDAGMKFVSWMEGMLPTFKAVGGEISAFIKDVKGLTDILFKGDFKGKPFGLEEDSAVVDFLFDIRDSALGVQGVLTTLFTGKFLGASKMFGQEEDSGFVDILFRIREAGLEVVDWFKADLWPSVKATAVTFRDAFSRIATIVGQFVAGVWARIEPMMPKIKQIFGTIGGIITDALELIRAVVGRVLVVIQDIWDRWGNQIMGFVAFMFKHIWGLISGALTIIRGIIKTVTGLISGDWGKVWEGIKTIASGAMELVRTFIQSIMGAIKGIWETSTSFLSRKWSELWGGVRDKTHEVMNSVRDKVKSVTDGLGGAFSGAVTAIGKAWDKVQSVTAKPVNFVIGTVYNNGIRKFINAIISLFGGTELAPIGEISSGSSGGGGGGGKGPLKMKDGGVLPGHTPGRDVHRFISATGGTLDLSGGETILRPEFTRAVGSGWVKDMNSIARSGGPRAVADALSHGHFKDGGILGSLKGAAKWVGNAMTGGVDKIGDILEMMVNLPDTISSWKKQINDNKGPAKFGEVFGKAASGTVDRAKQWIQDAAGRIGVGGGGGGLPVASFNPGGTVSVGGSLLDSSTYAKVMTAQKLAGMAFNITQGSYRPATSYSGTTHTGGGALDIVGGNLPVINSALRQTGFASWIRNPSQGPWPWHIHALEMGNSKLSRSAAAQVQTYLAGGNGLGGYSRGVQAAAPGWAMIDENGDEWVNFRGGERVLPNGVSPVAGTQQFVGTMRITNWQEGMVELKGEFVDEMDWRENR